jgi:hypothetical protein
MVMPCEGMTEKVLTLPSWFERIGEQPLDFSSGDDRISFSRWVICQGPRQQSSGGDWTNELLVVVDSGGHLWEHHRNQHYEDAGTTIYRRRMFMPLDTGLLRAWDVNGWPMFAKLEEALRRS